MKSFLKILKVVSIFTVLVYGALLFFLSRQVGGYRAFIVQSGSMEPTIQTGSLIVTQRVNPHDLKEQDIVTFIRPDNTQEFVTHRILSISKPEDVPLFKTKGDHNDTADNWTLVGGGVVGKVVQIIPHLGYAMSFVRSKVGIALLIVVPAIFIIFDEIKIVVNLIRERKRTIKSDTTVTASMLLLLGISTCVFTRSTHAIFSDTVTLANNTVHVSEEPEVTSTPTPTPDPEGDVGNCSQMPDITIEGNGEGSQNEVVVSIDCETAVIQSNESTIENTVSVQNTASSSSVRITNFTNSSKH